MNNKTSQQNCDVINQLDISTNRLKIAKFIEKDIPYNVTHELNPEIMRYIRDPISEKEVIKRTSKVAQAYNGVEQQWVLFAIREKNSNDYVGMICFRYESIENNTVEIGWRLGLEHQGKGYATEAAKAVLDYIVNKTKPHKVVAYCMNEHTASKNVMRKLGMQQEARLRQFSKLGGKWFDEAIFGLIVD